MTYYLTLIPLHQNRTPKHSRGKFIDLRPALMDSVPSTALEKTTSTNEMTQNIFCQSSAFYYFICGTLDTLELFLTYLY